MRAKTAKALRALANGDRDTLQALKKSWRMKEHGQEIDIAMIAQGRARGQSTINHGKGNRQKIPVYLDTIKYGKSTWWQRIKIETRQAYQRASQAIQARLRKTPEQEG